MEAIFWIDLKKIGEIFVIEMGGWNLIELNGEFLRWNLNALKFFSVMEFIGFLKW